MRGHTSRLALTVFIASLLALMPCSLPVTGADKAPPLETVEAGTAIGVRTLDHIRMASSDGRIFSGLIDQDVRTAKGNVTIPRGADVELAVRQISEHEFTLDLESVTVNGRRMGIHAEGIPLKQKVALTVGDGGAGRDSDSGMIGAIIGALSWGGDGTEILGAPGTVPRRDVQLATRGKTVKLPAGSLVVFRLNKPLRAGAPDIGFSKNGQHFHSGYGTVAGNTTAYEAGLEAGKRDRQRNGAFAPETSRWANAEYLDYQTGYQRGFDETPGQTGGNGIQIGADHYVRWNGPPDSQVYVRVNNERRLFSVDETGVQPAPWIRMGFRYVFTLVDQNGKEIARDENDLRIPRKRKP